MLPIRSLRSEREQWEKGLGRDILANCERKGVDSCRQRLRATAFCISTGLLVCWASGGGGGGGGGGSSACGGGGGCERGRVRFRLYENTYLKWVPKITRGPKKRRAVQQFNSTPGRRGDECADSEPKVSCLVQPLAAPLAAQQFHALLQHARGAKNEAAFRYNIRTAFLGSIM
jgi:hypothetical protein